MAVRQVIIHGGQHKTGSSFVQNTLFDNRDLLAQHGVLFPESGLHHRSPAAGRRHLGLRMSVAQQGRSSFALARLLDELEQSTCDLAVISYEGIYTPDFDLSVLADALAPYEPILLAYLRNPVDYVESKYREWVRLNAYSAEIDDFYAEHGANVDYTTTARLAAEAFGRDRVVIRSIGMLADRSSLVADVLGVGGVAEIPEGIVLSTADNPSSETDYTLTKLIANQMFHAGDVDARLICDRRPFESGEGDGRIMDDAMRDLLQGKPWDDYVSVLDAYGHDASGVTSKWAERPIHQGFHDAETRLRVVEHVRTLHRDDAEQKQHARDKRAEQQAEISRRAKKLGSTRSALQASVDEVDRLRSRLGAMSVQLDDLRAEHAFARRSLADAREKERTARRSLHELKEQQAAARSFGRTVANFARRP